MKLELQIYNKKTLPMNISKLLTEIVMLFQCSEILFYKLH